MATRMHKDSRRMYTWWWESHISPKNSKWLQENLTDMDSNVKTMIKLIEEDADSFARRAEMYYKKRPELMKLVKEIYRAYHALAERYDNATGVLKQAHKTMSEAFPNQFSKLSGDELPETDAQTPEWVHHMKEESDYVTIGFDSIKARKGLNFDEVEDSSSQEMSKLEKKIQTLKESLAMLEAEKETGRVKYQKNQEESLSKLELELSKAQLKSKELNEREDRAEGQVQALNEVIDKLNEAKEASLLQYEQYREAISNLQCSLSDSKERTEKISSMEAKLIAAEEDSRRFKEQAKKAESDVESFKQALVKFTEEKEVCMETISSLQLKISVLKEEIEKHKNEVENKVQKLNDANKKCLLLEQSNQSLNYELESAVMKISSQTHELTENKEKLGRLWSSLQEERARFVEAETAFQTLQHLHAKTQEEMRYVGSQLQNKLQIVRDFETQNEELHNKIQKMLLENKSLSGEVEIRIDKGNALQQDIYYLKEELNAFNQKHQAILSQIDAVGFKSDSLESSVRDLQDENLGLKQIVEKETSEKVELLEKFELLEKLIQKNTVLENSLLKLSAELEEARFNIKMLEDSIESLLVEKSTIISQLKKTTGDLEKLSEEKTFLENSLSDAHDKLEWLEMKLTNMEDLCHLLETEKFKLINEKGILKSEVEITQKRHTEIEEKSCALEIEKLVTLFKVKEIQAYLDAEKQEVSIFTKRSDIQVATMQSQISLLEDESQLRRRKLDEELENSMDSQIETFILLKCVQDLKEKSQVLLIKSNASEKLISVLELQNHEKQAEVESFSEHLKIFRTGLYQLLNVVEIDIGNADGEKIGQDQTCLNQVLSKLEDLKSDLHMTFDDNGRLSVELSVLLTLLRQLNLDLKILEKGKHDVDIVLNDRNEQLSIMRIKSYELLQKIKELHFDVKEREQKEKELMDQVENLQEILKETYDELRTAKTVNEQLSCEILEGKEFLSLKEKELSEAECKLVAIELEKSELQITADAACKSLEDEMVCKSTENEYLKRTISCLEGENEKLKAQFTAHIPVLISLKDAMSSLENCTNFNPMEKDMKKAIDPIESFNEVSEMTLSELQNLKKRLKSVEHFIVQMETVANDKLATAMKQIDDLSSKIALDKVINQKTISEISELRNKLLAKDIMPYGINHKDNDLSELRNYYNGDEIKAVKKENRDTSSEICLEKELSVDIQDISRRFSSYRGEMSNKKVLERLNSDAQKLVNLQNMVQELKTKMAITEKSGKRTYVVEWDTLKEQLEESVGTIKQLFEQNDKLMKNIKEKTIDFEENGEDTTQTRVTEHARRLSEKIGRLQLEVQKIQFVLLKLDDQKESIRGKAKIAQFKRRVLLSDYLYGNRRSIRIKKMSKFGSCGFQPQTSD